MVLLGEAQPYEGEAGRRRGEIREDVLDVLTGTGQSQARIAQAVGRGKNDGSVRRALRDLKDEGLADHDGDGWVRMEVAS
jgi:DNA-binding IclR family transcriptional regulator